MIIGKTPKEEQHDRIPKEDVHVEEYEELIAKVYHRMVNKYGEWVTYHKESLFQQGYMGLCKAKQSYDPSRGTFVTLGYLKIHTEMTRYLTKKWNKQKREVYLEEALEERGDAVNNYAWEDYQGGYSIDYDKLANHFKYWRDRYAVMAVCEKWNKRKKVKYMKEPIDKAEARCDRVLQDMITLVTIWYGGTFND